MKRFLLAILLSLTLFGCEPLIFSSHEPKDEINILAVGDIMLGRDVRHFMEQSGLDHPFQNIAPLREKIEKEYDIVLANLEGPIVTNPVRYGYAPVFGFMPDTAEILARNGFKLVSLANNHTFDRAEKGYEETKQFLQQSEIDFFGHFNEISDHSYLIKEINDVKVAFVGVNDATVKLDKEKAVQLIRELREKSDYIIVFPHWGIEYQHRPSQRQEDLAHAFIDAGADIIIGHHPHVVQTIEKYNDRFIIYSLGNFIFDQYFSRDTGEAITVGIHLSKGKTHLNLFPIKIEKTVPRLMTENEKEEFFARFLQWKTYTAENQVKIVNGYID